MANTEEIRRLKVMRKNKMSMFNKKLNHQQTLLEGEASTQKLYEAFEELHKASLTLETAHKS